MRYLITGLAPHDFSQWFDLSDDELAAHGMRRFIADETPGFPCRVSLQDAPVGEELILLPWNHLPAPSAWQASGPIFVRKQAGQQAEYIDQLPPVLDQPQRLFSVRAYDAQGAMQEADVADGGAALVVLLQHLLAMPQVDFLHGHSARRGCYFARVVRG
jgi:hypothetical protein